MPERYHATATVAAYDRAPMKDPDLNDPRVKDAMAHVKALLGFIGDDPEREGLLETPKRVVKAMHEHFQGYSMRPEDVLSKTFTEIEGYDQMVLLSDIDVHSHCEHHMVPVPYTHLTLPTNKEV